MATQVRETNPATIESRETALTLINNAAFYDSVKPVMQLLATRLVSRTFDKEKAQTALANLVTAALKSKEWAIVYGAWRPTVADRKRAAAEMLDHYAEQIIELADEYAGPEYVAVKVFDYDRDMYGNPTAKHRVFTSTADGGTVKRFGHTWSPRRQQIGYGSHLDSCPDALNKAGMSPANYEKISVTGSRSETETVVLYKRRAFAI